MAPRALLKRILRLSAAAVVVGEVASTANSAWNSLKFDRWGDASAHLAVLVLSSCVRALFFLQRANSNLLWSFFSHALYLDVVVDCIRTTKTWQSPDFSHPLAAYLLVAVHSTPQCILTLAQSITSSSHVHWSFGFTLLSLAWSLVSYEVQDLFVSRRHVVQRSAVAGSTLPLMLFRTLELATRILTLAAAVASVCRLARTAAARVDPSGLLCFASYAVWSCMVLLTAVAVWTARILTRFCQSRGAAQQTPASTHWYCWLVLAVSFWPVTSPSSHGRVRCLVTPVCYFCVRFMEHAMLWLLSWQAVEAAFTLDPRQPPGYEQGLVLCASFSQALVLLPVASSAARRALWPACENSTLNRYHRKTEASPVVLPTPVRTVSAAAVAELMALQQHKRGPRPRRRVVPVS